MWGLRCRFLLQAYWDLSHSGDVEKPHDWLTMLQGDWWSWWFYIHIHMLIPKKNVTPSSQQSQRWRWDEIDGSVFECSRHPVMRYVDAQPCQDSCGCVMPPTGPSRPVLFVRTQYPYTVCPMWLCMRLGSKPRRHLKWHVYSDYLLAITESNHVVASNIFQGHSYGYVHLIWYDMIWYDI